MQPVLRQARAGRLSRRSCFRVGLARERIIELKREAARIETAVAIAPYRFDSHWLVGAKTRLMDRFSPQVELIHLPGACYAGGTLNLFRDQETTTACTPRPTRKNRVRFALGRKRLVDLRSAPLIDLRFENFMNWAHQLNRYLPLSLLLRQTFGGRDERVTILLPKAMPKLIADIYRHFEFDVVVTDEDVAGCRLSWSVENENSLHSHVHLMVRQVTDGRDNRFFHHIDGLPKKIFIARRGTRKISNFAEIEDLLVERGYVTVYPEEHSPLVQIAMIRQASAIVAIHGAGLGPILYRQPGSELTLLEIMPAGMMTDFFRITCDQVGGRYCAVRGRLKSAYIEPAYGASPMLEFSFDDFEVDSESLKVALEILRNGELADGYPERWDDELGNSIRPRSHFVV